MSTTIAEDLTRLGDLIPDAEARRQLGDPSEMTWSRWEADKELGLPPAVVIRRRKHRFQNQIDAFKQRLLLDALKRRSK